MRNRTHPTTNYFLNGGYPMSFAGGSAAPIGDMMTVVGDAPFGRGRGRIFMLVEATAVFLALIGTTLSASRMGQRSREQGICWVNQTEIAPGQSSWECLRLDRRSCYNS